MVNRAAVGVTSARERERPVIANLLQFMLYDLSPFYGEWIDDGGRYAYGWLDAYWADPDRFPYIIRVEGQLAGFALVMAHSPISRRSPCWFMAEFFVLKAQRRRKIGETALGRIVAMHPGRWEIAAITKNTAANAFWDRCLSGSRYPDLVAESVAHDGFDWLVRTFIANRREARS